MKVTQFGVLADGAPIQMFVLENRGGFLAKVITYGATLTEMWVPDSNGALADVVLGFDHLESYTGKHPWFGSTVGRVANRIAKAKFSLNGKEYALDVNDPPHSLHGGQLGLSRRVWTAESRDVGNGDSVRLTCTSRDGDAGFPGNVSVEVLYRLTDDNELHIQYLATTDRPTPVNLTNHSYFNLGNATDILREILSVAASRYTPVDNTLIPTGEVRSVQATPLDFTTPTPIGARIAEMQGDPGGYDHNFVLDGSDGLKLAARVLDPHSRRQMEVWTTEPAVQFYSGNFLDGTITGKRGVVYTKHSGFCLETQHYPDALHHPNFPTIILQPGKVFRSETIYKFSIG